MPRLKISEFDAASLGDLTSADVVPIVSNENNKKVSLAVLSDYVWQDLGLGGAALLSVGQVAGTVAAGDDSRITGAAQKSQNLADLASASTARTNLGLAIGTDVQAFDTDLNAIAALTSAADKVPYATGAGTWALADFTAAGRALVDDADASAQRTTLGLGTMATQAASAVAITGGSITGITDIAVADGGTGASTAAAARTALGTDLATNVNFAPEITGATARTVQAKARETLSVTDRQAVGDNSTDNSTALQAAITYARENDRRLAIPKGTYAHGTGLSVEMSTYVDGAFILEGEGYTAYPYTGGSTLRHTGSAAAAMRFAGSSANNQDGNLELRNFAIVGDSTATSDSSGQPGIHADYLNLTVLNNLFVGYHGGNGATLNTCFSLRIEGGSYFQNFGNGIYFDGAANRVRVKDVVAYLNGRDPTSVDQANIWINGNGNASYGPYIDNCDVSYSGRTLCAMDGAHGSPTISSVVVSGGTATVTTATAHGLTTGNKIAINLAATTALRSTTSAKTITVTSTTAFTFTTGAADGTYNSASDPRLRISTYANGLLLTGTYGTVINSFYCEDPGGYAAYIGSNNKGVTFNGGFVLDGYIIIDSAQHVDIGGIYFSGTGGLTVGEANNRATVNVRSSNSFVDGAVLSLPSFYMKDGVRYGPSVPTTGTWAVGEFLRNSTPSATSPVVEWTCITAGTPGTFRAEKWLTIKDTTAARPTLTASDIGVTYLDTTLDADGKPIWWTGTAWVDATGLAV